MDVKCSMCMDPITVPEGEENGALCVCLVRFIPRCIYTPMGKENAMSNTRNGRQAKDGRRNDAAIRQAERGGITDEQQISRLTKAGHGHCREVLRLRKKGGTDETSD